MPVGFLGGALAVLTVAAVCVVLLYAAGIWWSVRDESFFRTLLDVIKVVPTKGFWK